MEFKGGGNNAATVTLDGGGLADFTAECFANVSVGNGYVMGGTGPNIPNVFVTTARLIQFRFSSSALFSTGVTMTVGQWYHIALVRSGTTFGCYVDGVYTPGNNQVGVSASGLFGIGCNSNAVGSGNWNGFIDEVRITRAARYLNNFTPPTAPFPDIASR
jgi:hypothetical protein